MTIVLCVNDTIMDYTGQKYNSWTFIGKTGQIKNKARDFLWLCRCNCGYEKAQVASQVIKGRTKSCTKCSLDKVRERNSLLYSATEATENHWKRRISSHSKDCDRRQVFITREYANSIFKKQGGLCSLTGLPIKFPTFRNDRTATASLDRIDPSKPYEKGNIQWVHKFANIMKMDLTQKEFLAVCSLVAQKNPIPLDLATKLLYSNGFDGKLSKRNSKRNSNQV